MSTSPPGRPSGSPVARFPIAVSAGITSAPPCVWSAGRTPEMYQLYIQRSRGEFSCAKGSCIKFQNAWVSDRTLCYLASGRPVVVQDTGSSSFLPDGEGMFRFSTAEQAVRAFDVINGDYEKHRRAARRIAEQFFDAKQVVKEILHQAPA